jgi:hypothetical protein
MSWGGAGSSLGTDAALPSCAEPTAPRTRHWATPSPATGNTNYRKYSFTEENAKYIYMDWIIDLCVIFLVHPGELYLVFQLTPCKKLSNSDETRN